MEHCNSTAHNLMEVNDNMRREDTGSELSPNWTEMTQECLIEIMSRLSLEQRWLGPMLVSKTWMKACQDPLLNSVLDLESRFLSIPESVTWYSPEFEEKVDSIIQSVVDWSQGGLKEIRVRHCTDRSVSYVAERCPNLEVLCVKSCLNVTDASMMKIASNCPKLHELDISLSYGISHESLTMVGMNCNKIEILKRNLHCWVNSAPRTTLALAPLAYLSTFPYTKNQRKEGEIIGSLMPQLKHLELQYSTSDAEGLALICEGCKNLQYLDVYGWIYIFHSTEIIDITSSLKYLKVLKFQEVPVLDSW